MWIVVVVEEYYPSVYHFETKDEAYAHYLTLAGGELVVHLAEVKASEYNPEHHSFERRKGQNKVSAFNVSW